MVVTISQRWRREAGKVTDLTPYLDNDPEWKAMFDEKDLEFNSYEGKVYGIPVSKEISYIYYNKDLFAEAGLRHRTLHMRHGMNSLMHVHFKI